MKKKNEQDEVKRLKRDGRRNERVGEEDNEGIRERKIRVNEMEKERNGEKERRHEGLRHEER